ncbi:MAG: hypothetical protein HF978_09585 [Desulfobacteraceae bacterium]|nr:hypothetical protein [Desulfobacteraceae bacterium]MBC2755787.1 hypothetical protein [Desulfobacteraceae bacterium]
MPIFTKEVATELFGELWMKMINETEFGPKLKESNMTILFVVDEPDITMFVDANGPLFDDEAKAKVPTVSMKMNGDTVHKFWLKQIFIPKALATRQIRAKGPVGKVLQLLPLLKPGQALYPEYCKKFNLPI